MKKNKLLFLHKTISFYIKNNLTKKIEKQMQLYMNIFFK